MQYSAAVEWHPGRAPLVLGSGRDLSGGLREREREGYIHIYIYIMYILYVSMYASVFRHVYISVNN